MTRSTNRSGDCVASAGNGTHDDDNDDDGVLLLLPGIRADDVID